MKIEAKTEGGKKEKIHRKCSLVPASIGQPRRQADLCSCKPVDQRVESAQGIHLQLWFGSKGGVETKGEKKKESRNAPRYVAAHG